MPRTGHIIHVYISIFGSKVSLFTYTRQQLVASCRDLYDRFRGREILGAQQICWYFIDVIDYVDDEIDVINDYDVSYCDNKNC